MSSKVQELSGFFAIVLLSGSLSATELPTPECPKLELSSAALAELLTGETTPSECAALARCLEAVATVRETLEPARSASSLCDQWQDGALAGLETRNPSSDPVPCRGLLDCVRRELELACLPPLAETEATERFAALCADGDQASTLTPTDRAGRIDAVLELRGRVSAASSPGLRVLRRRVTMCLDFLLYLDQVESAPAN